MAGLARESGTSEDTLRLRDQVLQTARELVRQSQGLRVSLQGLSLDRVIKEAKVPRTSVYRIWPNREAFHIDLMCYLAAPDWNNPQTFDDETFQRIRVTIAENLARLDTIEGRRDTLRELCRTVTQYNFDQMSSSPLWRTTMALNSTVASLSDDDARERVLAAMRRAEFEWISGFAGIYEDIAVILGLTLRDGLTFEQLAMGAAASLDGMGLRSLVAPELTGSTVESTNSRGEKETWRLPGYMFWILYEGSVTFDDDYDSGRAMAAYLKRLASSEARLASSASSLDGSLPPDVSIGRTP